MNRTFRICFLGLCAFSLGISHSHAFLGGVLKKDEKRVVNSEQLTNQESAASALLAKAQGFQSSGKQRQARDTYKSIVNSYPRTDAAAEAQFQYARILQAD